MKNKGIYVRKFLFLVNQCHEELKMASNDCLDNLDNYLLECNHINYSYGFKF